MNTVNNKFKDHSRFNRWVHNLDEKDKSLTPLARKSKWVLIVTAVFVLFGLSFILFPKVKVKSESLETPTDNLQHGKEQVQTAVKSAFELPVDSFENHIKTLIHEELPEKE